MKIVVIDGQGGKIGKQLVEEILKTAPHAEITAVGTNSIATAAMIKGGARAVATGENTILVACRTADLIVGPIGIVIADAMLGEITPAIAAAVGASAARKVLVPVNRCGAVVAGTEGRSMSELIQAAAKAVGDSLRES